MAPDRSAHAWLTAGASTTPKQTERCKRSNYPHCLEEGGQLKSHSLERLVSQRRHLTHHCSGKSFGAWDQTCARMRICLHSGALPSHGTLLSKPSGVLQDKHGGGHSPSVRQSPPRSPHLLLLSPGPPTLPHLSAKPQSCLRSPRQLPTLFSQSVTSQPPAGVETTGMWWCTPFVDTHTLPTTLNIVRRPVNYSPEPSTSRDSGVQSNNEEADSKGLTWLGWGLGGWK